MPDYRELLALSDAEHARVDPVVSNLLVARSITTLAHLNVTYYQRVADEWAGLVRLRLHEAEQHFWAAPEQWKNDIHFFRLGVLSYVLDHDIGIAYKEDQRGVTSVAYTDPSDLFLNGVMDTLRGTCGSMATLHVVIGQRLGWPVSLACVNSHLICRYDDGRVIHNIEATQTGRGGFQSDPDEYLIRERRLPRIAVVSGSDLRALSPREMLGLFVGFRGRHMRDTDQWQEAEIDYLTARSLFPKSRRLFTDTLGLALMRGEDLFDPGEVGGPQSVAAAYPVRFLTSVEAENALSRQPYGFAGGDANLYRYCFNDPVNHIDPSGNRILVRERDKARTDIVSPINVLRDDLYHGIGWSGGMDSVKLSLSQGPVGIRDQGQDLYSVCLYDSVPSETWGRLQAILKPSKAGERNGDALTLDQRLALIIEKSLRMDNVIVSNTSGNDRRPMNAMYLTPGGWNAATVFDRTAGRLIWTKLPDGQTFDSLDILTSNKCRELNYQGDAIDIPVLWTSLGNASDFAKLGLYKGTEEGGYSLDRAAKAIKRLGGGNQQATGTLVEQLVIRRESFVDRLRNSIERGLTRYCYEDKPGKVQDGCPELLYRLLDGIGELIGLKASGKGGLGKALKAYQLDPNKGILDLLLESLGFTWDRIVTVLLDQLSKELKTDVGRLIPVVLSVIDAISRLTSDKGEAGSSPLMQLLQNPGKYLDKELDTTGLAENLKAAAQEAVKKSVDEIQKEIPAAAGQVVKAAAKKVIPGAGWITSVIDLAEFFDEDNPNIQDDREAFMKIWGTIRGAVANVAENNIERIDSDIYNGLVQGGPAVIRVLAALTGTKPVFDKIKTAIEKVQSQMEMLIRKAATSLAGPAKKVVNKFQLPKNTILMSTPRQLKNGRVLSLQVIGNEVEVVLNSDPNKLRDLVSTWEACPGNEQSLKKKLSDTKDEAKIAKEAGVRIYEKIRQQGGGKLDAAGLLKEANGNQQITIALDKIQRYLDDIILPEFEPKNDVLAMPTEIDRASFKDIKVQFKDPKTSLPDFAYFPQFISATIYPLPGSRDTIKAPIPEYDQSTKTGVSRTANKGKIKTLKENILTTIPVAKRNFADFDKYDGAHFIAASLGGFDEPGNIFPTSSTINKSFFKSCEGLATRVARVCKRKILYSVKTVYPPMSPDPNPDFPTSVTITILVGSRAGKTPSIPITEVSIKQGLNGVFTISDVQSSAPNNISDCSSIFNVK